MFRASPFSEYISIQQGHPLLSCRLPAEPLLQGRRMVSPKRLQLCDLLQTVEVLVPDGALHNELAEAASKVSCQTGSGLAES